MRTILFVYMKTKYRQNQFTSGEKWRTHSPYRGQRDNEIDWRAEGNLLRGWWNSVFWYRFGLLGDLAIFVNLAMNSPRSLLLTVYWKFFHCSPLIGQPPGSLQWFQRVLCFKTSAHLSKAMSTALSKVIFPKRLMFSAPFCPCMVHEGCDVWACVFWMVKFHCKASDPFGPRLPWQCHHQTFWKTKEPIWEARADVAPTFSWAHDFDLIGVNLNIIERQLCWIRPWTTGWYSLASFKLPKAATWGLNHHTCAED